MKKLFVGYFLLIASAFGQMAPVVNDITRSVVPISVQLGGSIDLRGTGIQVGPGAVVIPEAVLTLKAQTSVNIFVRGKPAKGFFSLGNGVMLLSVPDLTLSVPILEGAKLATGEQPAWYIGYRNGQLVSVLGKVMVNTADTVIPEFLDIGIGWGIFSLDGKLLAIVRDYATAPIAVPLGAPSRAQIAITTQSGASIMAVVLKTTGISTKF